MPARLLPALASATVLTLAGLTLPAGTASADPGCAPVIDPASVTYTPTVLVVGAKGKRATKHQQAAAAVTAPCADDDGTDLQTEVVLSPHDALESLGTTDDHAAYPSTGAHEYGVFTEYAIRARDLRNAYAGTWTTQLFVTDTSGDTAHDYDEVDGPSIRVLRDATVTLKARGSVKHGHKLTLKGTLTRADWNKHKDTAYGKQPVQLQFRVKGGAWSAVTDVTSSSKGRFAVKVKPSSTGYYRVAFAGTSSTDAATSKARHVRVK